MAADLPPEAGVIRNGEDLLPLVGKLEGAADDYISPSGAVGKNQIKPGTAAQYGFNEPERLTDPEYNDNVAKAILNDNWKTFGNDPAATLVGYQAGKGAAAKWVASGKQGPLKPETVQYLTRAVGYVQGGNFPKPETLKDGDQEAPPAFDPLPPQAQGKADYQRLLEMGQTPDDVAQWKQQKQWEMLTEGKKTPAEVDSYFGETQPTADRLDAYIHANYGKVTPEEAPKIASNPLEALQAGWGMGNVGQFMNAGGPPKFSISPDASLSTRLMAGAAQMAGDAPAMIIGGSGGAALGTEVAPVAGTSVGAGAGAFMLPTAMREVMSDYYRRGEIASFGDFMQMAGQSAFNTLKSGLIGAVLGPVGKYVGAPLEKAVGGSAGRILGITAGNEAMATAATGIQAAVDGRVPDRQDFLVNSILMLPFSAFHIAAEKAIPSDLAMMLAKHMESTWRETGVTPNDIRNMANTDPVVTQEIASENINGDPITPKINATAPNEPPPFAKTPDTQVDMAAPNEATLKSSPLVENPPAGPTKLETDRIDTKPTEEELNAKASEFIGEPRKPDWSVKGLFNTFLHNYVSIYTYGRAIDNLLIKKGIYDRNTQWGIEDALRKVGAARSIASYLIGKGGMDAYGEKTDAPALKDAFDAVKKDSGGKGNAEDFINYMVAKRANEKEDQGFESGHTLTREERDQLIAYGDGKFARGADLWNKVMDNVLQFGRDSGIFSDKQTESMKRDNTMYISFRRLMGDDTVLPNSAWGSAKSFRVVTSPVKQFEGNERQIRDPLLATIDNIHRIVEMSLRNQAIRQIISLSQKYSEGPDGGPAIFTKDGQTFKTATGKGEASIAEPDSDLFKPYQVEDTKAYESFLAERVVRQQLAPNKFVYLNEGKAETWSAIDDNLAGMMRGADSPGTMLAPVALAAGVAKVWRAGVAAPVDFALRVLLVRHPVTAMLYDANHPGPHMFYKGLFDTLTKSEVYDEYRRMGGAGTSMVELDRNYLRENLQDILGKSGYRDKGWNVVQDALQAVQVFHSLLDTSNRLGYYKTRVGEGMEPAKAASAARTAYIDMAEQAGSSAIRTVARVVPFFRVSLLGTKFVAEGIANDPLKSTLYAVGAITAPTALLYAANYIQDKYGDLPESEQFKEVSRLDKDTHWILPSANGVRIKIPYPYTVGPFFGGMVNRTLDFWAQNDPEAFDDWAHNMVKQVEPDFAPPFAIPVYEKAANQNFSTGKQLMPDKFIGPTGITGDMQWTDSTTETAKGIAHALAFVPGSKALGLDSPAWIERYVNDGFGPTGMALLRVINQPFKKTTTPWEFSDSPFLGSFFARNPTLNAQSIQDFKSEFQKMESANNTYREALKREAKGSMTDDEAAAKAADAFPNLKKYSGFDKEISMRWSAVESIQYLKDKELADDPNKSDAQNKIDATGIRRQTYDTNLSLMIKGSRQALKDMQDEAAGAEEGRKQAEQELKARNAR